MWVLKFETEQAAMDRSFQEAAARLGDAHTTEYWWGWAQHGDEFWLYVDEEIEGSSSVSM